MARAVLVPLEEPERPSPGPAAEQQQFWVHLQPAASWKKTEREQAELAARAIVTRAVEIHMPRMVFLPFGA